MTVQYLLGIKMPNYLGDMQMKSSKMTVQIFMAISLISAPFRLTAEVEAEAISPSYKRSVEAMTAEQAEAELASLTNLYRLRDKVQQLQTGMTEIRASAIFSEKDSPAWLEFKNYFQEAKRLTIILQFAKEGMPLPSGDLEIKEAGAAFRDKYLTAELIRQIADGELSLSAMQDDPEYAAFIIELDDLSQKLTQVWKKDFEEATAEAAATAKAAEAAIEKEATEKAAAAKKLEAELVTLKRAHDSFIAFELGKTIFAFGCLYSLFTKLSFIK